MSKTHNETNPQNDSVDSGSITLKIGGLINRLKLFKEVGDITIVNTPLNKSDYSTALKEYDNLNTTAKKTTQFPSSADKAEFLFDLNKCQAVIAVRAGQDASTYLKAWQSANSNDFMTGLQTILEERIKFLQETGDITKINKPLDSSEYTSSKSIYDALVKIMKKYPLSDDIRAKLSFDLNKCQAISAVRAGKPADQDASTYLEAWEKSANADDFMTGLQTILEERIKFLQETGDITKINNPLDSSEYQSSKSIYDSLVKTIKDYSLSDEIKTKLSFDLNKCQAISAVRAGKPADQDASTYLKACGSVSANRNDFIIELYKIINLQKKVANNVQNPELKITTQLYKPLLEQAFEVVGSFLNSNNYEAALDEITPLIKYANTVLTLEKYVEICIKEAAPQKLEECWNQCLMTTSSTIEKSKTLAGIFQKLHDTFESLASVDPKTKAKYEDIAKQANERAIQYTPQKEEVQVSQEKPTVSVSKKEEKALKELKALEKAQVTLGTKLINTKAKVEVIKVETLFDAEAEAEKAKLRDKLKAEEAELMARLEAKKNKQKLDIEVEKSTQLSEIRGQGSSTKDTLVTPTAPPKEVEASDSSNVAETSDSSKKSVSKGIYPSISTFKAELAADNIAAVKASSSINVYNNSPYSYTAGTHKTAPITAVMPTSRTADPTATDAKTAVEDVVEETVGANAPNTLVDTVINLLNSNDSNDKEVYKIFIKSFENSRTTSEENYQLLKAIAEKTTDTDIQLAALTAAKSQTNNQKQQAELFLSKGKILLSLGKKEQASNEFGEAASYNHDIYKDVAVETLKSLYESGNHEVGYWYLSKTQNFNHKDPSLAQKLLEFSHYVKLVHGAQGEAACLIKAYLCAPNADVLVRVSNDLSIMRHTPYAADYYKNYCAIRGTDQVETYLQGLLPEIENHM
ncbi:cell envelope integrity protein TolA [Candidatus Tisiphia endosymbiont of Ceraclea dissimilis]|uniref:cell envelope integrity protein TolA n=1 Tax=Candidatus Tisiphia endosymbiont of Ceraclea dissimilis TaxID=3077928 RepID=UPI003CCAE8B0